MGNTVFSSSEILYEFHQRIIELKYTRYLAHDEAAIPWTESHMLAVLDYVFSSSKSLPGIRQRIIELKYRRYLDHDEAAILWTESHLLAVLDYVLKLEGINFRALNYPGYEWARRLKPDNDRIVARMVVSFVRNIQKLFKVPKFQQFSDKDKTTHKNEILAAFMNFLLQLLYHRTGSMESFEDGINCLEKELRFIVAVLGDSVLICDENKEVQNLLAEFEEVANEAGPLVHSFCFTRGPLLKSIAIDALLKSIDLLKYKIVRFSYLLPFVSRTCMTPKTSVVDSLLIVDSLIYDLEYIMNQQDDLIADVKDHFKTIHQGLISVQSLIKDIGAPQPSEVGELKEPLMLIGDVAYEAEYLINSFMIGDAPLWYLTFRLADVIQKIEVIGIGLREIRKNCDRALKVAGNFNAQISLQGKKLSEVDDIIVGHEDTTTYILDQLVGGSNQLQIISVFGMAGLGKTTLAKKLYNHPLVDDRFDRRAWCIISQTYHKKNLLVGMLMSLTSTLDKVTSLNMEEERLVEHIYKSLKGRRYLIVMDDIWASNSWDDFQRCFPDDGNGSRILFTTRNKDVAPPNSIIHSLSPLSNDLCWELFEKKVFRSEPCPPELQGIGKEIAANCCGLPLAVVVVTGILSNMEKEESTWKEVGENIASYIFDGGDNSLMRILELSYKHLPEHLKLCFLYFGAFPEDEEIPLWKLKFQKSVEIVAEEYVMDLIDKSLVMVAKRRPDGGIKACIIHDLLRDLCLKIAEEENFLKLVDNYSIHERGHHLVSIRHPLTPFGQHIRSFHGDLLDSPFYVLNMTLLRVLDFKSMLDGARLIGIEYLVQLRFLVINEFPASIGSLVNLEFLLVKTRELVFIPSVIVKMKKLRYLHFSHHAFFDEDCNSFQTNNLEFLSNLCIYYLKDEEMLKCSPHLRRLKCICKPLMEEKGTCRYPDLRFLTQLESLTMTTTFQYPGSEMAEINLPLNIKKLTLSGLRLAWEKVSVIGRLPYLEVLKLGSAAFVGETWDTRDGEFQLLTFLKLENLHLKQWSTSSSEHFPRLRQLVLRDCFALQEIPCEIGEIVTLQLIEVQGSCKKSLVESAIQIEQEQQEMGNEMLRVIITHAQEMTRDVSSSSTLGMK